jgi:nucleoside-diphosphate-sugar epimerase
MSRILITGAGGFLGFHLAKALAGRGERVVCVDSFIRGERDAHVAALSALPNVEFIEADLARPEQVAALPADIGTIYHLAAMNGTQNFYERPMDVIRNCTLPTLLLAERYGPGGGLRRFVYAGTSESYASTVTLFNWPVPTSEEVPLSIEDVTNPRWSYAASKMHGEVVAAQAGRTYNMPFNVIRYHNAYGPRMGDRHVVPDFYARVRQGRYELFGYEDTRSFLYVDDAVRATLLVGESDACANEIINIGGTQEITILALAKRMLAVRGLEAEIELHPSPSGSVKRRAPDTSKLVRLTGFRERVSLDDGLTATAKFYLDDELVRSELVLGA